MLSSPHKKSTLSPDKAQEAENKIKQNNFAAHTGKKKKQTLKMRKFLFMWIQGFHFEVDAVKGSSNVEFQKAQLKNMHGIFHSVTCFRIVNLVFKWFRHMWHVQDRNTKSHGCAPECSFRSNRSPPEPRWSPGKGMCASQKKEGQNCV